MSAPKPKASAFSYLSGTFSSCQHEANSHFFRLYSTFGLMHQNFVTLGGVCVCFSKSVRKGHFRNVWVSGGGGVGGHSFVHGAVNGRTHRAQARLQGSLIIPTPIRCHLCPFPQGPGLHWGTHPPACDWEHTSFGTPLGHSAGTNEATTAPTPENAPCWHEITRPREICLPSIPSYADDCTELCWAFGDALLTPCTDQHGRPVWTVALP